MLSVMAWAAGLAGPVLAQPVDLPPAAPIMVELVTPVNDDLGHYMPVAVSGSYAFMGVIASAAPVTSVTVGTAPAVLYPINYRVFQAPGNYHVIGFRAWVFLEPSWTVQVSVLDQGGERVQVPFLPDANVTMSRLNFWRQRQPNDAFVALRTSVGHAMLGHYDLALPTLNTFVDTQPQYPVGQHLRALTYWDMDDWDGALADLQAVVAGAPDAYAPRVDLARLLHSMGDWDNAMVHYETALEIRPNAAEAHYLLGQALREQGDLELALEQQQLALAAFPEFPDADYEMGVIQAEQGNNDQAFYRFRQATRSNPRSGDPYMALARMYYNRGNYPQAWRMVQRAERYGAVAPPGLIDALSDAMNEPYSALRARGY
jgi:tetratricopeptide (TPR) repeat protein